MTELDAREAALRDELTAMREEIKQLQALQVEYHQQLTEEVGLAQHQAVGDAVAEEREQLLRLVMEGEAGALEAIWKYKENNRDKIIEAETTRKGLLDDMLKRYSDLFIQDH